MDSLLLRISGRWAHFKKPETNNNPLTHDFITKTALIGMIGAVTGMDREAMRPLFPQLSEDLRYGVALERPVKKQSWAFTLRRFAAERSRLEVVGLSPRPFEFLKDPCFRVVVVLHSERSREPFERFARLVQESRTHYDPLLGLHNCNAELAWLGRGAATEQSGRFETPGFVPRGLRPSPPMSGAYRTGAERLPSFQDNDMWNPPDRYVEVAYMDFPRTGTPAALRGEGDHHILRWSESKEEAWCLI